MIKNPTETGSPKTIMVVEDEPSLRAAMVDLLQLKNFLTLEARDGQEAVDVALAKHPDLILLDLIMPVMDGMTALKNIRLDRWGARVPVIILTNVSATDEGLVNDMVTHKPLRYLIKSDWNLHDVIKMIREVLETHGTR